VVFSTTAHGASLYSLRSSRILLTKNPVQFQGPKHCHRVCRPMSSLESSVTLSRNVLITCVEIAWAVHYILSARYGQDRYLCRSLTFSLLWKANPQPTKLPSRSKRVPHFVRLEWTNLIMSALPMQVRDVLIYCCCSRCCQNRMIKIFKL